MLDALDHGFCSVEADIFLTVHLTINKKTAKDGAKTLAKLDKMGVRNLSLSTPDKKFLAELLAIQNKANTFNFTMRWDLPVPYSDINPVAFETEDDQVPAGAGRAWLYVEPDGDVLPAQGEADKLMGNMLTDAWEKIYAQ